MYLKLFNKQTKGDQAMKQTCQSESCFTTATKAGWLEPCDQSDANSAPQGTAWSHPAPALQSLQD